MNELIASLLQIALAWTGYTLPTSLPAVQIVAPADMPCACMGVFLYSRRYHGYGTSMEYPARLLLRDDVNLETPYGRSILLHELVHALQSREGPAEFATPLWHQREREAYHVQWRFLRGAGIATRQDLNMPRSDE